MPDLQDSFDHAMLAYTTGDLDTAIAGFQRVLDSEPGHFDAQLALGLALSRKGDHAGAIAAGHKAERLRPNEQLVHTNLSLFYMKAGDKPAAEHHALQARIASWKSTPTTPHAPQPDSASTPPPLAIAKPKPAGYVVSGAAPAASPPATAPAAKPTPALSWRNQPRVATPTPPPTPAPPTTPPPDPAQP